MQLQNQPHWPGGEIHRVRSCWAREGKRTITKQDYHVFQKSHVSQTMIGSQFRNVNTHSKRFSIPGAPHSDEILMLKMEVFRKFFIEFSRSNVIKNKIMVTPEAMLVQAETLLLQKLSYPNETRKLHPDNCHAP